jgi:hypothetical protein
MTPDLTLAVHFQPDCALAGVQPFGEFVPLRSGDSCRFDPAGSGRWAPPVHGHEQDEEDLAAVVARLEAAYRSALRERLSARVPDRPSAAVVSIAASLPTDSQAWIRDALASHGWGLAATQEPLWSAAELLAGSASRQLPPQPRPRYFVFDALATDLVLAEVSAEFRCERCQILPGRAVDPRIELVAQLLVQDAAEQARWTGGEGERAVEAERLRPLALRAVARLDHEVPRPDFVTEYVVLKDGTCTERAVHVLRDNVDWRTRQAVTQLLSDCVAFMSASSEAPDLSATVLAAGSLFANPKIAESLGSAAGVTTLASLSFDAATQSILKGALSRARSLHPASAPPRPEPANRRRPLAPSVPLAPDPPETRGQTPIEAAPVTTVPLAGPAAGTPQGSQPKENPFAAIARPLVVAALWLGLMVLGYLFGTCLN